MYTVCNIIVVGYGLPEIETKCLSSIIRYTSYPYILSFYNNYNKKTTLTQVWNKFIASCSENNYICLLNSDTQVTKNWLIKLLYSLEHIPNCKFIGPSTNACHSIQCTIPTYEEAQKHENEVEVINDPISGFCFVFPKKVWEQLEGFDERYDFYGSESDFISRGQTKFGWTCAWRKDSFVQHLGGASIKASGKDEKAERDRAKKLYWSEREKGQ